MMSQHGTTTPENPAPTASLYTELPYPADGIVRTTTARILTKNLALLAPEIRDRHPLRIADVGCGTGEVTAGIARVFPGAQVVGIDINPLSLEKAREVANRYRLNITFARCNIGDNLRETLQSTGAADGELFDLVVSGGVLHHMDDPAVGFAEVRRITRPDGIFFGFIYSSAGRREDMAVKALLDEMLPREATFQQRAEAIRVLGLANRHTLFSALKTLRQRMKVGPPLAPLELLRLYFSRNRLVHVSDRYSNPCEHLYTFGQLRQMVERVGWSFVALADQGGLPTSAEQHTRNPRVLALLRQMTPEALYEYFAHYYRTSGFNFFLRPASHPAADGAKA